MARIAGVNLPTNKRVVIALQYIHGIGQAKAQQIMDNLEKNVRDRLAAEYTAEQLPVPDLDFAYSVVRYEDFGGPFTNPNRRAGPIEGSANDMDARPFILNMPLLRENHPTADLSVALIYAVSVVFQPVQE